MKSGTTQPRATYMCRIPPANGEKFHVVGTVNESGTTDEPSRAFWTNERLRLLARYVTDASGLFEGVITNAD